MTPQKFRILSVLCKLLLSATIAASAPNVQDVVLQSDQSQLVILPDEPATVVVGNPAIADITIEGKTLFVHPRAFGVTNIIALDASGQRLGEYLVHIVYEDSYGMATYSPSGRQSYSCRKDCEPVMRIGDRKGFFDDFNSQAKNKNALAAAQALGEELLVRPPSSFTIIPSGP